MGEKFGMELFNERDRSLTVHDIESRLASFRDRCSELEDAMENDNLSEKEIESALQEATKTFVEGLLQEKDRFSRIFSTQQGSLYFRLDGGESLRVKSKALENGERSMEVQPVMMKVYFVEPGSIKRHENGYTSLRNNRWHSDKIMFSEQKEACIGSVPLEVGLAHQMRTGESLRCEFDKEMGQSSCFIECDSDSDYPETEVWRNVPSHEGHAIVKVLK